MMDRRDFLKGLAMASGATVASPLERLLARGLDGIDTSGYGGLRPVRDETTGLPLLQLPKGFRYISFGWAGDPLDDGGRTPAFHDGMAAFPGADGRVVLVRNHEIAAGAVLGRRAVYDEGAGGGTTRLVFDPGRGALVESRAHLGGTARNCAGGATPWGSWITCEETLAGPAPGAPYRRPHGYAFEAPVDGEPTATPLVAMGRFVHEAVAVDAATGIVYQTEDAREAGLYRFIPDQPGTLAAGGRLQMLAVVDRPGVLLATAQRRDARYRIAWIDIDEPDRAHFDAARQDGKGVFLQGRLKGGACFARLEGALADGGRIYVTSTSGGDAHVGQVWELDPAAGELRLVYESPGIERLNMPDNVCASPRGGLLLCEDGTRNPGVHGLTREGQIFRFARNNVELRGERNGLRGDFRSGEIAGATFSPDGRWLFFNLQVPGITVAITGPWEDGIL
jgi:secreted PhoX family phosphatase